MKKFHVHIYKVKALMEVDLEAHDESDAREKAMEHLSDKPFKKADCKQIAVVYPTKKSN